MSTNVSHALPAIHPTIGYDVGDAAHHTAEFADYGATALAVTGVELARDPDQRARLLDGPQQ